MALFIVGMISIAARNVPRETTISYRLGPGHGSYTHVRVAYLLEGEEVNTVSFPFPDGSPRTLNHTVDLVPGHYRIVADLTRGRQRVQVERSLDVPADGEVVIDLFDRAFAQVTEIKSGYVNRLQAFRISLATSAGLISSSSATTQAT